MEPFEYLMQVKKISAAENTLFELCEYLYDYDSAFNNFLRENEDFLEEIIDYNSIFTEIDSASSVFENDLVPIKSTLKILNNKIESLNTINLEKLEKLQAIKAMSECLLNLALINKRGINFYKLGVTADEKVYKIVHDDFNYSFNNLKEAVPKFDYEILKHFVSNFRFDFDNTEYLEYYSPIILEEFKKIKSEADYILKSRDNLQSEIAAVEEVIKELLRSFGIKLNNITSELNEIKENLDSLLEEHDEKKAIETLILLEKNANFLVNNELIVWSESKDLNLLKEAFEITYGTWIYSEAFEEEGDLCKIENLINAI